MAQPPVTTPTLPVTQTPNEFIFSLYKSWYPEAQDKLPNDSLCFQSNWPFINLLFLHGWTKQQILGGLPCCAPAKERREKGWLIIKQIGNEHAPWLKNKPLPKQVYREFVLKGKKIYIYTPPLGVWIISRVKIRGSKAFPMWSNITSGTCAKKGRHRWIHWRETHPQRGGGGCHHIGFTQSCQCSDRRSFTVSCMKCTQALIMPTVDGLNYTLCACVCVCARERTCLINRQNPPHQSLTNRQHSRLVPEVRIWAKWLN